MTKVGVIGCGKRFVNVYHDILKSLNYQLHIWNRTKSKLEDFCKKNDCNIVHNLSEFNSIKPDVILCFVPPESQYEILENLSDISCYILLETPILDNRIINLPKKLGVLEQWPHLPLEQLKNKIYNLGIISRPYFVFNDGRTFDYHAMAQLRSYLNFPIPNQAKGTIKNYRNPGIIDASGSLNSKDHDWTLGQLEMSDGSILSYSFSYNCKSLLTIPIQFIRSYSIDGSIVTGRMKEIGNDYEFIDIRILDKITKIPKICEVKIDREKDCTKSIMLDNACIWENSYSKFLFNDQQTAIATLIDDAIKEKVYTCNNSYIDGICINALKQSGYHNQVIRMR